jgi:NAD-dependent dihydropyrimidine dehydrogenase PreA subunit/flavodoxin
MIFYFSSTGNDKYVATRIAASTDDRILSIAGCLQKNRLTFSLENKENFGLVIPTYFGGFPAIVIDFLNKVTINWADHNYVFFVATYGAGAGNIAVESQKRLADLGKRPDAVFTIKMVDNWNPYFDMTDKNYISKAESEAEPAIEDAISRVSEHECTDVPKKQEPSVIQSISTHIYNNCRKTKKFSVSSACVGCGLCERQCPVNAIRIENKHPVWVKPECTLCLGCVHRCPVNAISYTKKTIGHGQYFNPNVKPDVM